MAARLDFIIGRAGTGKSHACMEAIRTQLMEQPMGSPLILLVPDHMTYRMERELAASIPQGKGYFRGYVFGLRRFARHILLEMSPNFAPRISEVGRRLLLRKILLHHQKEGDLSVFGRSVRKRGFTESLSEAIQEFKSYRLTSQTLREAATKLTKQNRLAEKLQEMALLSEEFEAEMAGRANDAEDMLEELAGKIPESPFLKEAEIWVDGFVLFNPQELSVLTALMQTVSRMHITLPLSGVVDARGALSLALPENTQETGVFHRSYETFQTLRQLAREEAGIASDMPLTYLSEPRRFANCPCLGHLEQELFVHEGNVYDGKAAIAITEAANRRIEVESMAADILRLVREEGRRFQEIGVLVRDEDAYFDLIRLAFEEYGVPFFIDGKRPSIHHPLAEFLRSSVEVVQRNWAYESIFRLLRTGLFPIAREEVDLLENYVLEFGIRGRRRWLQEEPWDYRRRYTLKAEEEIGESARAKLEQIDGLRRAVAAPLAKFDEAFRRAKMLQDRVIALCDLLEELGIPELLTAWKDAAEEEGRLVESEEHGKIWSDVMKLFDQLVEVSGTESMEAAEFATILGEGLDALEIALIPPGLDYVTVASFDRNSLGGTPALYILGADADTMPQRQNEGGLLSDAERLHVAEALKELEESGEGKHTISRGGQDRAFVEKYFLYRGFTEASAYLWVSYPLAGSEGEGIGPSSYVRRIQKLFPQAHFRSIPLEMIRREDDLLLAAPRPAMTGLISALQGVREQGSLAPLWRDVYNWMLDKEPDSPSLQLALDGLFAKGGEGTLPDFLARELFAPKRFLQGSVTQFERFHACPFAHFSQYGLRLQERRTYQFRNMDFGQLLHEVLREYGSFVQQAYDSHWEKVPTEVREKKCLALVEDIVPRLQSEILQSKAGYRHLKGRIAATIIRLIHHLSSWAEASSFQPAFFEKGFGKSTDEIRLSPILLMDGFRLSFSGQIDRIDVHDHAPYYLVVDYKTGKKVEGVSLFEVYYGLRLQLLVYMLVAKELLKKRGEERLPAGALYSLLRNPVLSVETRLSEDELQKEVQKALKMPGWVLANLDIASAIDRTFSFIKAKPSKSKKGKNPDGSPAMEFSDSMLKTGNVRTAEDFALLLDYVECILRDTGEAILSGEVEAKPYRIKKKNNKNACAYCSFNDVCGFDPEVPGFAYNDISPLDDMEARTRIEERMKEKNGAGEEGNEG